MPSKVKGVLPEIPEVASRRSRHVKGSESPSSKKKIRYSPIRKTTSRHRVKTPPVSKEEEQFLSWIRTNNSLHVNPQVMKTVDHSDFSIPLLPLPPPSTMRRYDGASSPQTANEMNKVLSLLWTQQQQQQPQPTTTRSRRR